MVWEASRLAQELYIQFRGGKLPLHLPPRWKLSTFAAFGAAKREPDMEALTQRALAEPVGSAPLRRRVSASDDVVVLVEDLTRVSPKRQVLRSVLRKLAEAGVLRRNITVVLSLGTHRKLSRAELAAAFGEDLVESHAFLNHDCEALDLVPIGTLASGRPVKINARVHAADFRIGIGSIFPHPMNGFGGGGKILFPGVADADSILEHHLSLTFSEGSDLGRLDGNPFYEKVTELALAGRLDFIVNSVLDHEDRLYDLVAGHPVEAHTAGAEISRRILTQRFPKRADVTVISAFPYTEGPQIMKPLVAAAKMTKPGGCIILAADCTVPFPEMYLAGSERFRERHRGCIAQAVLDSFRARKKILEEGQPELNMSMAHAMVLQEGFRVVLVADGIPDADIRRMGFQPAGGVGEALEAAGAICGPTPEVNVVPSGGVILPEVGGT